MQEKRKTKALLLYQKKSSFSLNSVSFQGANPFKKLLKHRVLGVSLPHTHIVANKQPSFMEDLLNEKKGGSEGQMVTTRCKAHQQMVKWLPHETEVQRELALDLRLMSFIEAHRSSWV